MTSLQKPTPSIMADEIVKALDGLKVFKEIEYKHGKFRISDLDQISFRTPAAFVSLVSGDPKIQHDGSIRLKIEGAIMIVTKTSNRNSDPWDISLKVTELVHRNAWNMSNINQPSGFKIIPVISGEESKKNQALTAFTWMQSMTIIDGPDRSRGAPDVVTKQGDKIEPIEGGL